MRRLSWNQPSARWTLTDILSVLVRGDTQTHSRGGDVNMKQTEVATSHRVPKPLEMERGKKCVFPSFWKHCWHLDLRLLAFRLGENKSVTLSHRKQIQVVRKVCRGISMWFSLEFHYWQMILAIFSCVYLLYTFYSLNLWTFLKTRLLFLLLSFECSLYIWI